MSQGSLLGDQADSSAQLQHRMCDPPSKNWERIWLWVSERINPIVVKEVRQSLKSRQFTISFGLTLLAAISWTLFAVSLMVPRIYYVPAGLPLLTGFFCILTLPLMVIIPFSAFRSLAAETEDSTFELLSISALSATQIVYGKMSSAMVQILLYLSALVPCIVLTYLLRGVSLFTILYMLGLTILFSISETALALMLAAVSRSKMVQNLVSVLALAGLLAGFAFWVGGLIAIMSEGVDPIASMGPSLYISIVATLTIVATAVSLVLRTAAAAIDFPSENNSTPLRIRLFGFIALVFFWCTLGIVAIRESGAAAALATFLFALLMFVGSIVCGERGVISPRAQRNLPKTFLGRVFLTFLYPGAGLGYIFILCIYTAVAATIICMSFYYGSELRNNQGLEIVCYLYVCYLATYLGVNRLLMLAVPRYIAGRVVGSVAMLSVVLILAHLLPLIAVFYLNDYRNFDYDWHQAFNIFWTISGIMDNSTIDVHATTIILTLSAVATFGLNLILCTRDVMLVRVAEPPRVQEDEESETPSEPDTPIDPFAD